MSDVTVRVVESKPFNGQECNVKARDSDGNLYCIQLVNPPPVNTLLVGIQRLRDIGSVESLTPNQPNIFLVGDKYYYRDLE